MPSPFTSPNATRAPPRKSGSPIPKKLASTAPSRPPKTVTRPPPVASADAATSANPSPSTSPTARNTPPVNAASNACTVRTVARVAPSITRNPATPPDPVPTTRSATPSPVTSPVATRGSLAPPEGTENATVPSALNTETAPDALPPTATSGGTGVRVIANVCAADTSCPPLAVPPLSRSRTVTVAVPVAPGAGV